MFDKKALKVSWKIIFFETKKNMESNAINELRSTSK